MMANLLLAVFVAVPFEDPDCAGALPQLQKVRALLDARQIPEAGQLLEPLQSQFPRCSAVLVALGRSELAKRNYDRANSLSQQALLSSPEDPGALALRGQMLAMQGQGKEGRELLERAVRADPGNAEACFQLGALYDRAKLNVEAVSMFGKTVAIRPGDPRAWDYLALNLEPLGKIDEAQEAYKRGLAVNKDPNFDWFLDYNYGRLLLKLNRLAESKVHLDRALELVPQLRTTHYDHAKLNVRLENWTEARRDAERALAIPDPSGLILDLQVYNLLAAIYTRLGEEELAHKYTQLSERTRVPLRTQERK